ncbi:hypothetical protein [Nocardioides sp. NPDC004968]|uniref:hypothetical protein n=1 Tax=Nocardioides sp. NPDC004968 TaxID=3155894 RepID=UPI0033ABF0D9
MSTEPIHDTKDHGTEPTPLAVHRDPSQGQAQSGPIQISKNGIAWVRPSDLPTMIAGRVIGRGLDLKAELVRRAKHPIRPHAPRARTTRTAIAASEPPSITHRPGGISL